MQTHVQKRGGNRVATHPHITLPIDRIFCLQYAKQYAYKNAQNGMQENTMECIPCPPGTFQTCATLQTCEW